MIIRLSIQVYPLDKDYSIFYEIPYDTEEEEFTEELSQKLLQIVKDNLNNNYQTIISTKIIKDWQDDNPLNKDTLIPYLKQQLLSGGIKNEI